MMILPAVLVGAVAGTEDSACASPVVPDPCSLAVVVAAAEAAPVGLGPTKALTGFEASGADADTGTDWPPAGIKSQYPPFGALFTGRPFSIADDGVAIPATSWPVCDDPDGPALGVTGEAAGAPGVVGLGVGEPAPKDCC